MSIITEKNHHEHLLGRLSARAEGGDALAQEALDHIRSLACELAELQHAEAERDHRGLREAADRAFHQRLRAAFPRTRT